MRKFSFTLTDITCLWLHKLRSRALIEVTICDLRSRERECIEPNACSARSGTKTIYSGPCLKHKNGRESPIRRKVIVQSKIAAF